MELVISLLSASLFHVQLVFGVKEIRVRISYIDIYQDISLPCLIT